MIRRRDWDRLLADEIAASLHRPFEWHDNDCCSFAARCVQAVTGQDFFSLFSGSYTNARQAARVVKANGGLLDIFDKLLGKRLPALTAQRGDILLTNMMSPHGELIAVCAGQFGFAPGPVQLTKCPQKVWLACWRIG